MPYLKHILEPQLRQAVDNLQARLPPPEVQTQARGPMLPGELAKHPVMDGAPSSGAYPAPPVPSTGVQRKGGQQTSGDRGAMSVANPAPQIETVDPRLQSDLGQYAMAVGSLPSAGGWLAFKRGAMGMYPVPQVNAVPEPAPTEAMQTPARNKKGQVVIPLAAGEPVGIAEDGQAIDKYGKKMGYLAQQGGDVRFGDRRAGDVSMEQTDGFAQDTLQQLYGKHLQAVKDNEGKYPAGYFKGMNAEQKDNVKKGVQALMQLERGTRT
jgi:hypothetical protein